MLYVGQNAAVLPMLPTYFGVLPEGLWWFMLLSFALAAVLLWVAGRLFRRLQLWRRPCGRSCEIPNRGA